MEPCGVVLSGVGCLELGSAICRLNKSSQKTAPETSSVFKTYSRLFEERKKQKEVHVEASLFNGLIESEVNSTRTPGKFKEVLGWNEEHRKETQEVVETTIWRVVKFPKSFYIVW